MKECQSYVARGMFFKTHAVVTEDPEPDWTGGGSETEDLVFLEPVRTQVGSSE